MSVAHYENFPVASFLVPASLRPAVLALYQFARSADDFADEGTDPSALRLARLADYQRELDRLERGEASTVAPFPDLARAVARHGLDIALLRDLLSAFTQDVTVSRYADEAALADYCRRSANPVGRLLLQLYGADHGANREASDAICTALQLINFWQDVAGDWRRGRVYLPQDQMARFGVTDHHIAGASADAAWSALMRHETGRTRSLLESGRPLVRALPWRLGLELAGVLAGGHWVLDRIDHVGGDVFRHRPQLRAGDWGTLAWRALFPTRRHRESRSGVTP